MAICKDCIAATGLRAAQASPCEGITISVTFSSGRKDTGSLITKENPSSLIGYDYVFTVGGQDYSIIYTGSQWVVLNSNGVKVYYSSATGSNNNLCPPRSGWTNINGEFSAFNVQELIPPGPSLDCVNTNGTFDADSTGWTVTNGVWTPDFTGGIRYDTVLLASVQQTNILTVGETYSISVGYYAPVFRDSCNPTQYAAGFIQIYAGTNFYRAPLDNTINDPSFLRTITIELTCEGNATLRVELQDANQCFATVSGAKGIVVDNICAVLLTNTTDPTGPSPLASVEYKDMGEVPAQINGMDYNTKLSQYQECLATKGTTFYNKIIGAVKCDYRELTKLKLIIGLLSQKNEDRALDCIYDRENVITAIYPELPTGNLPVLVEGQTTIIVDGDLSQFETFKFHIQAVTDYAVLEGSIVKNTDVSAIYIPSGGLPFLILGYSFSLLNTLGDYYATPATNVVANILYSQPGPPVNNTIIPSGTISTFALFSVANGTTWALYAPITASTIPVDFTTTIIDAVYDVNDDTTTIILQDPLPGTIGAATYEIEFVSENDNTYLKTFTDFANRFCADCMITGQAPTPSTPATPSLEILKTPLVGETGIQITTEFNQQITI